MSKPISRPYLAKRRFIPCLQRAATASRSKHKPLPWLAFAERTIIAPRHTFIPTSTNSHCSLQSSFFTPSWKQPFPNPPRRAPPIRQPPSKISFRVVCERQRFPNLSEADKTRLSNYISRWSTSTIRSAVSSITFIIGFVILPPIAQALSNVGNHVGSAQFSVVITGGFMPVVGILFAMLSSTAVSTLRQRQQDLRDLLHQELALIRMLLVMIKDEGLVRLLLKYTLQLDLETFSREENGISFDHEVPGTRTAVRREELFSKSEETLWKCFAISNDLRLRSEVEAAIRSLVTFRTKRRAVLDSGLPQIHFTIITLLGVSMLVAFCLLASNDLRVSELIPVRALFGTLFGMLSMTQSLLSDLNEPFNGDYGVAPWRLYRTIELLELRLNESQNGTASNSH